MINARSETVAEKNAFKPSFKKRRCIVPADGFYEWKKLDGVKRKQPYFIHRPDDEPFAFAGLWSVWRGPEKDSDEVQLRSTTILTTEANEPMSAIHDRMPVVLPPSACGSCGRHLAWYDNIPVFSYLMLGGKCRGCQSKISLQYPIVELLTAIMFGGLWYVFGPSLAFASRAIFGCLLIVLFAIDLEHHLLPNVLTLPGIVIGFGFSLFGEPGNWIIEVLRQNVKTERR